MTIKERLSIVDVISSYIKVEQVGNNYKAKCPFHNEKTPSFFISSDRGTYYCFGCGQKGDVFSFVEHFEGTDFLGALKILADKAGVVLESYDKEKKDDKDKYYQIMEKACLFFESKYSINPEARSYLLDRGLSDETIKSFRIGFAPDTWRSVSEYLIDQGYNKEDIEKVGLIKQGEKGFYDRFRSRIMFPIFDSTSRVIAFSGRIFGKENEIDAKYLNSPETILYHKSNVFYGIDRAKSAIRTRGYSIIVEGQMDLVLSHQSGFTNTLAVSGTAFGDNVDHESKISNLGLVRRISPNIIFAFDGDNAGSRACARAALVALSLDMQVKVATLPEGKDPADIIRDNVDTWKEIIKNSVNIITFYTNKIVGKSNDLRTRGKYIVETIFPFLLKINSSIECSSYISDIASKTGINEKSIIEDFEKYKKNNFKEIPKEENTNTEKVSSRRDILEERLFGILFWQKDDHKNQKDLESLFKHLSDTVGQEIYDKMYDTYEPYRDKLSFEAQVWYRSSNDTIIRDVKEIIMNLEEEILIQNKNSLLPLDTEEKVIQFNNLSKRVEMIKQQRI